MVGNVGWNEYWVKFYEEVMGFVNFFDDKNQHRIFSLDE
jgi:hypothetical protein